MWFYNDSPHTGSICFQRNPFKAALASHVYYFPLLWQICIFSFGYFLPLKTHLTMFCPLTWIVVSAFQRISIQLKLHKTQVSHPFSACVFHLCPRLVFNCSFPLFLCRIPHFYTFLFCSAIFISGKSKRPRPELKPCSTAGQGLSAGVMSFTFS